MAGLSETERREQARSIYAAALSAVQPGSSVRSALTRSGDQLIAGQQSLALSRGKTWLFAAGKAAAAMASAGQEILGEYLHGGVVIGAGPAPAGLSPALRWISGEHPLPGSGSVEGAEQLMAIARAAGAEDRILFLLSGGASAMLCLPSAELTLQDMREVFQVLLASGLDIHEVNAVRRHLSQIKGGQLAAAAFPATVCTLALSDVPGDALQSISSGPTVADPSTFSEAIAALQRAGAWSALPPAAQEQLRRGSAGLLPETPKPADPRLACSHAEVIARNRDALEGAAAQARRLGYEPEIVEACMQGEARELGPQLLQDALRRRRERGAPFCLLAGGETTVTLGEQSGEGGRNQEFALAAAVHAPPGEEDWLLLSAGTDGRDGPGAAAGGFATDRSQARAAHQGLDLEAALESHDSGTVLQALDDLLITGPSGTNVMDVVIFLG